MSNKVLKVGETFSSLQELKEFIKHLEREHNHVLSITDGITIKSASRKIQWVKDYADEALKYKYVTYGCYKSSKSSTQSRSLGLRNKPSVKSNCPWKMQVNLADKGVNKGKALVIHYLNNEHNHEVEPRVRKKDRIKRRLSLMGHHNYTASSTPRNDRASARSSYGCVSANNMRHADDFVCDDNEQPQEKYAPTNTRIKADQERIRELLADTVSLICQRGLPYHKELKVEGVIGVTLDNSDVLVVHINDRFGYNRANRQPVPTPENKSVRYGSAVHLRHNVPRKVVKQKTEPVKTPEDQLAAALVQIGADSEPNVTVGEADQSELIQMDDNYIEQYNTADEDVKYIVHHTEAPPSKRRHVDVGNEACGGDEMITAAANLLDVSEQIEVLKQQEREHQSQMSSIKSQLNDLEAMEATVGRLQQGDDAGASVRQLELDSGASSVGQEDQVVEQCTSVEELDDLELRMQDPQQYWAVKSRLQTIAGASISSLTSDVLDQLMSEELMAKFADDDSTSDVGDSGVRLFTEYPSIELLLNAVCTERFGSFEYVVNGMKKAAAKHMKKGYV